MVDRCFDAVKIDDLTDEETNDLIETLRKRRDLHRARGEQENLERSLLNDADELAQDAAEAARIEKRNRLINIQRRAELMRLADTADQAMDDPSLGVQAATVGATRVFEGSKRSTYARGQALFTEYGGGFIADLRRENLIPDFNSGAIEREIAQELEQITLPDGRPGISGNNKAKRIAQIMDKYRKSIVSRKNRAGAWIKPLQGYIIRQSHDMHKMRRAGFENWRDSILPLLDEERTFGDADPQEFLKSAYQGLKSGVHITSGEPDIDLKLAFKGPGNLGKRISQHRVLHFRNADAFMEYNRQFGARGLKEAFVNELNMSSKQIALMETFGPNPRAMFDSVLKDLKERFRDDDKKLARLNRQSLEWQFQQVDGTAMIPGHTGWAHAAGTIRGINNWSKLGGAALSSLTDVAFHASAIPRQSRTILRSWGQAIQNIGEGFTPGERRELYDLIGTGLDGELGDLASRFSPADSVPGAVSKTNQVFFKLNFLAPFTDANKRGVGAMLSRDLAMQKARSWDALPEDMTRMLSRYGLDADKWDIARQAVRTGKDAGIDDPREYLMPEDIKNLPDEAFGGRSAREIQRLKDDIETSVRSYIVDRAEHASPTPGAREQAMLQVGTRRGTVVGEAVRFIAQFKSFPVTVLTRNIGEALFSGGAKNFREALIGGKGDMLGLANMIVGSTILGYLAMSAKDLAKGRTPEDPAKFETWAAAFVQGGGAGIYGDFLLGETNRFGRSLLGTLAGPTLGTVNDIDRIRAKILADEPIAAETLRLAMGNAPFANLFYTRLALDYLVLFQLQEMASPGYLRRMERNIKRDNNQEFILPPSRRIPTGGGNRAFEGVR